MFLPFLLPARLWSSLPVPHPGVPLPLPTSPPSSPLPTRKALSGSSRTRFYEVSDLHGFVTLLLGPEAGDCWWEGTLSLEPLSGGQPPWGGETMQPDTDASFSIKQLSVCLNMQGYIPLTL